MRDDLALARPYADAAYAHAAAKGRIGEWEEALATLAGLVGISQFADAMRRPGIDSGKLFALVHEALGGDLDPEFANFAKVLVSNGRLALSGAIHGRFLELKLQSEGTRKVSVRTAFPLGDDGLRQLEQQILAKSGSRRIDFDVQVDPELIGGARIQIGDDVIDLSMRDQLKRLSRSIRH